MTGLPDQNPSSDPTIVAQAIVAMLEAMVKEEESPFARHALKDAAERAASLLAEATA